MDLDIDEPSNITGMGGLINQTGAQPNTDFSNLEQEVIRSLGGFSQPSKAPRVDPVSNFTKELNTFSSAKADDFDFGFGGGPSSKDDDFDFDFGSSKKDDDFNFDFGNSKKDDERKRTYDFSYLDNDFSSRTHEERRQQVVNSVYSDGPTWNLENDRQNDEKARLLDQIDNMRDMLIDEGAEKEIKMLQPLTSNNSLRDIQDRYNLLMIKIDRRRCGSFAEDVIMLGVHLVEHFFDGKKEFFGHKPDMTGWNKTVATKIRRMRLPLAVSTQNMMSGLGMGVLPRLVMELAPSAILYSKMNKSIEGSAHVTEEEFSDASNKLRNLES